MCSSSEIKIVKAVAIAVVLFLIPGCVGDAAQTVIVENQFGEPLTLFEQGIRVREIPASSSFRHGVMQFQGEWTFEVKRADGVVLAAQTWTWEELRAAGWRLVFQPTVNSELRAGVAEQTVGR